MSDRRLLKSNGHVAHRSLEGLVEADHFVDGTRMRAKTGGTGLHRAPDGALERELLTGDAFCLLEEPEDKTFGWAFGFAEKDGYSGWVPFNDLRDWRAPTHRVAVRDTIALVAPDVKANDVPIALGFGDLLSVEEVDGEWTRVDLHRPLWVPTGHLRPVNALWRSPLEVARTFMGVPYFWGGNRSTGIDCSGLVQVAMHACGWTCPGDSDLQEAMAGQALDDGDALQEGDLIFWSGHVAIATGPDRMIHANAHHMIVAEEEIAPAIDRIAATDTGPVKSRLRPERQPLSSLVF